MRTLGLLALALTLVAAEARADGRTEPSSNESRRRQVAAPYVGVDWRVLGIADRVSNGPGFQVGVLLFEHLRIGFAGFARPGPINPATYELNLPAGQTYKGQSSLDLRSDGSLFGLQLAPVLSLGKARRFEIELPVILGFGAFGFYLTGDDRRTPDGRRVSAWENELMDGRDASSGFAVDVGIRFSVDVYRRWLRVYAGAHYSSVIGYDAFLQDSYEGFSGAVGLEVRGVRSEP